jgi:AcrR family transcriptional regulator
VPPTRRARALATHRRLIEIAVEQFSSQPYNEVAVGKIAERAGVAHGVVFHHFGTKRGLYLEAVREISHRLFELDATDPAASPGTQLRDVLCQHFTRMEQNEELMLGYVRGSLALAADPEAWNVLEQRRERMVDWMCDVVGLDPESVALRLTLRSAGDNLDQMSVRWLRQGRRFPVDTMAEAMVHLVIGALRAAQELDPAVQTAQAVRLLTDPTLDTVRSARADTGPAPRHAAGSAR